ncbi:hypothetical protein HX089_05460 [Myroides odoratimimus]|uniref:hypothetical protein n=1 Tax=Myroides odoratimimus TaxID=76832 RepID=UPI00257665A0|nr:hypothetical protein [Myroides odoratimimus]MDM1505410.1 hypothetical protein [Myroides odoratimimus]MDM1515837.1 hypothetical protein [Myroides odoratimimus]
MYLIDLVYKTILSIANSDLRGNIKPSEIRLLINTTVEEVYEGYFYELNRIQNRSNKGLIESGIGNLPERIREKLNYYKEEKELSIKDNQVVLPSDLRYLESVFLDDNEVELFKNRSSFNINKSLARKSYPIGYKSNGDNIICYPIGYKIATINYLRKIKVPNWTYVMVRGAEVFNPSASDFQDLDIHSSELYNVIIKTLQKVGINLKEQDLQQVMAQQQNIEFNQEIQS